MGNDAGGAEKERGYSVVGGAKEKGNDRRRSGCK